MNRQQTTCPAQSRQVAWRLVYALGRRGEVLAALPPVECLSNHLVRTLSFDDVTHHGRIVVALKETRRLMEEIDDLIPSWPIVQAGPPRRSATSLEGQRWLEIAGWGTI